MEKRRDLMDVVDIIEDHVSVENALRMILDAADTKDLPSEGILPVFHDSYLEDLVVSILQKVTGKKY
jgi:hypothetical protein